MKEVSPSLFLRVKLEHQFGESNAPLSSVSNRHLCICHPTRSSTNYISNRIPFSSVFLILTTENFIHEGHLLYCTSNTDISPLILELKYFSETEGLVPCEFLSMGFEKEEIRVLNSGLVRISLALGKLFNLFDLISLIIEYNN